MVDSTQLMPYNNYVFSAKTSTYTFSGDSISTKLELSTIGSKNQTYIGIKKIKVSTADLQEYQGDFYSSELDTQYSLFIKDSSLQIKIPRKEGVKISPFIKDIFADGIIIRFSRNKKIISMVFSCLMADCETYVLIK